MKTRVYTPQNMRPVESSNNDNGSIDEKELHACDPSSGTCDYDCGSITDTNSNNITAGRDITPRNPRPGDYQDMATKALLWASQGPSQGNKPAHAEGIPQPPRPRRYPDPLWSPHLLPDPRVEGVFQRPYPSNTSFYDIEVPTNMPDRAPGQPNLHMPLQQRSAGFRTDAPTWYDGTYNHMDSRDFGSELTMTTRQYGGMPGCPVYEAKWQYRGSSPGLFSIGTRNGESGGV